MGVKRSPKWGKKEADMGGKKANMGSKKGSLKWGVKESHGEKEAQMGVKRCPKCKAVGRGDQTTRLVRV